MKLALDELRGRPAPGADDGAATAPRGACWRGCRRGQPHRAAGAGRSLSAGHEPSMRWAARATPSASSSTTLRASGVAGVEGIGSTCCPSTPRNARSSTSSSSNDGGTARTRCSPASASRRAPSTPCRELMRACHPSSRRAVKKFLARAGARSSAGPRRRLTGPGGRTKACSDFRGRRRARPPVPKRLGHQRARGVRPTPSAAIDAPPPRFAPTLLEFRTRTGSRPSARRDRRVPRVYEHPAPSAGRSTARFRPLDGGVGVLHVHKALNISA